MVNCQTVDHVHDIVNNMNLDFICLMKTKVTTFQIRFFYNKFKHQWDWATIPSTGLSGGTIVFLSKRVGKVTPVAISKKVLHLVISSSTKRWILSTVCNL